MLKSELDIGLTFIQIARSFHQDTPADHRECNERIFIKAQFAYDAAMRFRDRVDCAPEETEFLDKLAQLKSGIEQLSKFF